MIVFDDEYFMRKALDNALKAAEEGEVPVGAVAVAGGHLLASAHNQIEKLKDATAHAEMILLTQASAAVGDWRLNDVTIYVTREPCLMCAGAMLNARVKRLVYAMPDDKIGAFGGSSCNIMAMAGVRSSLEVKGGVMREEAEALTRQFFKFVRTRKQHPRQKLAMCQEELN